MNYFLCIKATVKAHERDKPTTKIVTPLEYAHYLDCEEIEKLIKQKMNEPSLEARWLKRLETLDAEKIDAFRLKVKDPNQRKEFVRFRKFSLYSRNFVT